MKNIKFDISGMTCSSCSSHVEKAVKSLNGIKSVNVNLILNSMEVNYDEKILSVDDIIKAVEDAGYGASISGNDIKKDDKKRLSKNNDISVMKKRLIISICFLIPLMYLSMHGMLYDILSIPVPNVIKSIFDGVENAILFLFTQILLLIPIVYVNRNYFISGIKKLIKKTPNMDSLISIGSGASIIYGLFSTIMVCYGIRNGKIEIVNEYLGNVYFESAGMILTLITFGKYLETKSKKRTTDAIEKLINLVPNTATVMRQDKEVIIDVSDIIVGDIVKVKPGGSIPIDGVIIEGESLVDESSITGESKLIYKSINDNAISGTINQSGYIKIEAKKVGKDTTISKIIELVEEASNSKAPISRLADKISGIFVPLVIIFAIITVIFWLLSGESFEVALNFGISVLVISCPCSLGLATPVAIMVGTGIGAKNGILIKSAESLEILHLIDTVVLDKTGTITEGKLKVTDVINYIDKEEFLKIAGSLEKNSEHSIAKAILDRLNEENISTYDTKKFEACFGKGVKANINGNMYYGGNALFMEENNIAMDETLKDVDKLLKKNKTLIYFANNQKVIGVIALLDTIKDTSYSAIKFLKDKKIDIYMLTGDNRFVANSVGESLGIKNIISEVLPNTKQEEIIKLQNKGKKVAFVGDGINDSPSLVQADVGIAIGAGTDIAIESADVVLIKNSLEDVVTAISLSKKVIKNIKENLFWAFFYNIVGIPIAAGVFYLSFGIKLTPMIGALAMSFSSVCVVTNALRLNCFKVNFKGDKKMKENVKVIHIEGMSCNHCKMSVQKALSCIDGVEVLEVNLENKKAIVKVASEYLTKNIIETIKEAGFEVTCIE